MLPHNYPLVEYKVDSILHSPGTRRRSDKPSPPAATLNARDQDQARLQFKTTDTVKLDNSTTKQKEEERMRSEPRSSTLKPGIRKNIEAPVSSGKFQTHKHKLIAKMFLFLNRYVRV